MKVPKKIGYDVDSCKRKVLWHLGIVVCCNREMFQVVAVDLLRQSEEVVGRRNRRSCRKIIVGN
jgi:hypothetical protein